MFRNKFDNRSGCEILSVVTNLGQVTLLLQPFLGCETDQQIENSLQTLKFTFLRQCFLQKVVNFALE